MEVFVLLPCFNESSHIRPLILRIHQALDPLRSSSTEELYKIDEYHVLAVDDGSTDGTGEILEEMALLYPIRVFHHDFMYACNVLFKGGNRVEEHNLEILKLFDVVYLYGLRYENLDEYSELLKEYVNDGGGLILDNGKILYEEEMSDTPDMHACISIAGFIAIPLLIKSTPIFTTLIREG